MKKIGKLIVMIFVCSLCVFGATEASAKENIYFSNDNGVSLTKDEYDFFTEMYWDGFQENMTEEEYNFFNDGKYFNLPVESKIVYDNPLTRGTSHTTANKSIKISKACGNICAITVSVNWINNPTIRSYDVIGAYLYNVTKTGTLGTNASAANGTTYASQTKYQDKGFGASIKLPTGSNVYVYQTYSTTKGGRIYATYQHAIRETTLEVSQKFDIDITGYGNVLKFYGDAVNLYDNMNGVDIDV